MHDSDQTIFLVDDDAAVRESLSLLIESENLAVQAYARAEDFLAACGPGRYGCAIIDLRMPGMGGMRLQEEMARRGILLPIIFLTGHGDIPTSVKAIKAGAFDFLTKPIDGTELLRSIDAVLKVERSRRMEAAQHATAASCVATLTPRELGVLKLAAEGSANKQIAQCLGISYRTVEIHRSRILRKTGATTLLQLVNIAKEAGMVE